MQDQFLSWKQFGIVILLTCSFVSVSSAQLRAYRCPGRDKKSSITVNYGADVAVSLKAEMAHEGSLRNSYPAAIGGYLWARFSEAGYRAPGLLVRLGVLADPLRFQVAQGGDGGWFTINRTQVRLEALAEIPLTMPGLQVLIGGGVEYSLDPGINTTEYVSTNGGNHHYVMNADSNFKELYTRMTKFIPFVSFGCRYNFEHSRWGLYGLVTQNLQQMFSNAYPLNYAVDGDVRSATINYLPLYLSVGATCRF